MTKEEVLQKVNDYCTEKAYTSETLTDEFKDKFSEFFAKKYPEETAISSDGVEDDINFNLKTAFSATSKGLTTKQKAFEVKENEYKNQIAELNKKLGKKEEKVEFELPEDVKEKLAALERFQNDEAKKSKFAEIVTLAKKNIRQDLHASFDKYVADKEVKLDETSEAQAKKFAERFQEIFRDSIGDIKPFTPHQTRKRDSDIMASIPRIKV